MSSTCRPGRRSTISSRCTAACFRRRSPIASATRSASTPWQSVTFRRTWTSTRSSPPAAPICACWRARICSIRTGRVTPPGCSATRCRGPIRTSRSSATRRASNSGSPEISRSCMSDEKSRTAAVTYGSYLKIDELLSLQQPRSTSSNGPEHDEMLFIVIHQVYELWFKELLHEFDRVRRLLEEDEPHRVQHTLKRILTILKVMVAQLDILETMTPLEFLSFRQRLQAASGFQSDRFRQIEFVLGLKSAPAIDRFPKGGRARAALERRYEESTLWDAFLEYLRREGYQFEDVPYTLISIYKNDPKNAALCERLVDLD